jgi:signal transduction histidine kinase
VEKEKVKNAKINALGNVTSSLAHNLKNPLSVIKATTSIIEATSNSVDKKTQERLNLIKVSTENMLNQIEDMLDFVKQKPLELQETSLSEILNIAIDNINKPKRIKINLPENDIKIKCDSAKLQVVFMNLISNSIDSVNGNGEITIDSYQNNQDTVMEVTDTGSINPDDLEKMFEVLYTTKPTGTGLGLPYCKSVIEQHGGSIEVSMNPTKFTIIIPRLD